MKRTAVLPRWYASAGSVLLTLNLLITPGCSGSGDEGSDGAGRIAAKYGLDRSEFIVLKKANKKPKDFEKALLKRKIEKLKEEGVVVQTTTPGKTTNKTH